MKLWQQRVVNEKRELDKKIKSLNIFIELPIWNELNDIERELLLQQQQLMRMYSTVLKTRIRLFK